MEIRDWSGEVARRAELEEHRRKVTSAILATPAEYLLETCKSRSFYFGGAAGSGYDLMPQDILWLLFRSEWNLASHPNVEEPCRVYVSFWGGRSGIVPLSAISDSAFLSLEDPKRTGSYSAVVDEELVTYECRQERMTYLILGPKVEGGRLLGEQVYTFHPGEPIPPSSITGEVPAAISVEEARRRGIEYAKVRFSGARR